MPVTILVVDDDQGLLVLIRNALRGENRHVATVPSGREALVWLERHPADLLLLDLRLRDIRGVEFLTALAEAGHRVPFIIITGQGDEREAVEMMKRGALDYLVKDVDFIEFLPTVVNRALEWQAKDRKLAETEAARTQAETKLAVAHSLLAEEFVDMSRLHRVSTRFVQQDDFQGLLEDIVEAAMSVTKADMGNLQLLEPQTDSLKIIAQRGFDQAFLDFFNVVHEGEAACGAALKRHKRLLIEDVSTSPVFARSPALPVLLKAGVRAVQSTPLLDRQGHLLGMFSTHYRQVHSFSERELRLLDLLARQAADLIERSVALETVRQRGEELAALLDMLPAYVWVAHDAGCRVITGNRAANELAGVLEGANVAQGKAAAPHAPHLRQLKPDGSEYRPEELPIQRAIATRQPVRGALVEFRFADDRCVQTVGDVVPLFDATGQVRGAVAAFFDITERRKLERALVEATEREQRRFGHDLHDGLGQRLTGLEMLSHVLAEDLKDHARDLAKQARRLNTELRETVSEARLISHSLAPVPLDGDGLMRGLSELASRTSRHKGVSCHFLCEPPVHLEDTSVATHLYRIAQEAVANALKHGKARKIEIRLAEQAGVLELCIENNGRLLPKMDRGNDGIGLNAMRYRAGLIGADLSIKPGVRRGARVSCTLRRKR